MEIVVGKEFGPAEFQDVRMDAPPFEVSPQIAGSTLCFGECLSSFSFCELACFVHDEARKRKRLIQERTHGFVPLWLASMRAGFMARRMNSRMLVRFFLVFWLSAKAL